MATTPDMKALRARAEELRKQLDYHAKQYYVYDAPEGKSTSFCDHAPLRISCYKAIARMLEAHPQYVQESLPVLRHSAEFETDDACREAARALVRKYMLTAL